MIPVTGHPGFPFQGEAKIPKANEHNRNEIGQPNVQMENCYLNVEEQYAPANPGQAHQVEARKPCTRLLIRAGPELKVQSSFQTKLLMMGACPDKFKPGEMLRELRTEHEQRNSEAIQYFALETHRT